MFRQWIVLPVLTVLTLGAGATSEGRAQYGPSYYPSPWVVSDPYQGYLRGTAAVIDAQGRFRVARQQAQLLREQVRQAKIATRRRRLEQRQWDRDHLWTLQDQQERFERIQLRHALNNPSGTEVCSGNPLNHLLRDLQKLDDLAIAGPDVRLTAELLEQIQVTTGHGGNAGLLRQERLHWPLALRDRHFRQDRERLTVLAPRAVYQATRGDVDPETLREMKRTVERMQRRLKDRTIHEQNSYIKAKNFLQQFEASLRVLRRPDADHYFGGDYAARGKTVRKLVRYLSARGLHFAPAVDGDEDAYAALHQALVAYDRQAHAAATLQVSR